MVLPFVFSPILLPFPPGGKEAVSKRLCGTEVAIWGLTMTDLDHKPLRAWVSQFSIYHTDHLSSLYFIGFSVSTLSEQCGKPY